MGGAIYISSATATFIGCSFEENFAVLGGGAVGGDYFISPCVFIGTSFARNHAGGLGGALLFASGGAGTNCGATLNSCSLVANVAAGFMRLIGAAIAIMLPNSILAKEATLILNGSIVAHHTDRQAIGVQGTAVYLANSLFIENGGDDAVNGYGGALFLQTSSTVHVHNCTFANNTAFTAGGAIAVDETSMLVIDVAAPSRFVGNRARLLGGGALFLFDGASCQAAIAAMIFEGNHAPVGASVSSGAPASAVPPHVISSKAHFHALPFRLGPATAILLTDTFIPGNATNLKWELHDCWGNTMSTYSPTAAEFFVGQLTSPCLTSGATIAINGILSFSSKLHAVPLQQCELSVEQVQPSAFIATGFIAATGVISAQECLPGTFWHQGELGCVACAAGSYAPLSGAAKCKPCPSLATCDDRVTPRSITGSWVFCVDGPDVPVVNCSAFDAVECTGGRCLANSTCSVRHAPAANNPLCSSCANGFSDVAGRCIGKQCLRSSRL